MGPGSAVVTVAISELQPPGGLGPSRCSSLRHISVLLDISPSEVRAFSEMIKRAKSLWLPVGSAHPCSGSACSLNLDRSLPGLLLCLWTAGTWEPTWAGIRTAARTLGLASSWCRCVQPKSLELEP